jgi:MSHA biogenesis protein MshN
MPSAHAAGASAPSAAAATSLKLVPQAALSSAAGGKVVAPVVETDHRAGTQPVAMSTGSSASSPAPDPKTVAFPPAGAKTEPLSPVSRVKVETHASMKGAHTDAPPPRPDTSQPHIDKRSQHLTPHQLAENDYRKAIALLNQGRLADAQDALRLALLQNPAHSSARQALFGVLLDGKKHAQAEQVLQDGLQLDPGRSGFAMALARLQVERGDTGAAVETLQKTAPAAHDSPDYLAFLAALLQRQARHQAAIDHYEAALRLAPQSGVWLMGLGISLQAVNRNPEAHSAFRRAKATNTLNPELQAFVDQRIRQLQ